MLYKKEEIWSIPNILSIIRILLVPVFVYCYFARFDNHYIFAAGTIVVSGLTDILDGIIARKFNMITSLGKVLDPIADKLTQGVTIICLSIGHPELFFVVVLLVAKELTMLLGAIVLYKSGYKPSESKWFGKLSTFAVFTLFIIVLASDIFKTQRLDVLVVAFGVAASICLVFSLFNYYPIFKDIQAGKADDTQQNKTD